MERFSLSEIQKQDLQIALNHKKSGNRSDPGTRKTAVANVLMWWLYHQYKYKSVFVMPSSLLRQNREHFLKCTPFSLDDIAIVQGTPQQRKAIMDSDAKVFLAGFDFFSPGKVQNPDLIPTPKKYTHLLRCRPNQVFFSKVAFKVVPLRTIKTKKNFPLYPFLNGKTKRMSYTDSDFSYLKVRHNIQCCTVDEFHFGYGNIESSRTINWLSAVDKMEYMYVMTGTLINGALSTAYPFIRAISPYYYGNIECFLNEHAIRGDFDKIEGWYNHDKLTQILEKHTVRHTFQEVHGEENLVHEHEILSMSEAHFQEYSAFQDTHMLTLEREYKEVEGGGVIALKCRQIMQCPEVIFKNKKFELTKDERIVNLIKEATSFGQRSLVFSVFPAEQYRLRELLEAEGIRVSLINGSETPTGTVRNQVAQAFENHQTDVMLATYETVAVGFDWNFLSLVVCAALDYQDSNFLQGYRRGIRGKREAPLRVITLEYACSQDYRIIEIVTRKMLDAQKVDPTVKVFDFQSSKELSA